MKGKNRINIAALALFEGVITIFVLLLSLAIVSRLTKDVSVGPLVAIMFFAVSLVNLIQTFEYRGLSGLLMVTHVCHTGIYLLIVLAAAVLGCTFYPMTVATIVCFLVFLSNRIISVIANRKIYNVLLNAGITLIILYVLFKFISTLEKTDIELLNVITLVIPFSAWAMLHILKISFSQIEIPTLQKIIRRTYAARVFFGMILLIVSFSFLFKIVEPDMPSYRDGLWYCFAIVTTIGFGDITAVTSFGKALSVLLGIYGIVFVALITSIIVNYYNEVANRTMQQADDLLRAEHGIEESISKACKVKQFCPYCGTKYPKEARFCMFCGSEIEGREESAKQYPEEKEEINS